MGAFGLKNMEFRKLGKGAPDCLAVKVDSGTGFLSLNAVLPLKAVQSKASEHL